jgi:hypothetical protein
MAPGHATGLQVVTPGFPADGLGCEESITG